MAILLKKAVRRCLLGVFLSQLTFMGVLALKSVTSDEDDELGLQSNYVSMVIKVTPLLFLTLAIYWWFKYGYEKEVL